MKVTRLGSGLYSATVNGVRFTIENMVEVRKEEGDESPGRGYEWLVESIEPGIVEEWFSTKRDAVEHLRAAEGSEGGADLRVTRLADFAVRPKAAE